MDVNEAIETRIEVRDYADDPVDDETKATILDAGRLASSGRNAQHWRFVLVDDDRTVDRLGELSPTGSWVAGADFAVAVLTPSDLRIGQLDAGRAITHMQLAAWANGVGSCIYTVDAPDVDDLLAVPDDYEVTLVAGFGYPAQEVRGRKDREPLSDLAFRNAFGEPLRLGSPG